MQLLWCPSKCLCEAKFFPSRCIFRGVCHSLLELSAQCIVCHLQNKRAGVDEVPVKWKNHSGCWLCALRIKPVIGCLAVFAWCACTSPKYSTFHRNKDVLVLFESIKMRCIEYNIQYDSLQEKIIIASHRYVQRVFWLWRLAKVAALGAMRP